VPSGNWVREHLKEAFDASALSVLALEDELNAALAQGLPPSLTKQIGRKRYDIGIDLVEIPYYGQSAQIEEEIRRGKARPGTTRIHAYATLALVHQGQRYEVALTFVWADETMEQVVQRLLAQAQRIGLRLRRAYLDKGFARQAVLVLLRQKRIPYLIPLPIKGKTGGLKALCQGKASYRTVHTFNVGTPHAYTTDVILLCRYRKGRYGRHGCQWFAYGIERVPLAHIFSLYRRRFGMESGYRQMHQIRARTTSANPTWRLLLVGVAFLLYNVYIQFRQNGRQINPYDRRARTPWLSLKRMAHMILRLIEQRLGVADFEMGGAT
jgi:putative transposase